MSARLPGAPGTAAVVAVCSCVTCAAARAPEHPQWTQWLEMAVSPLDSVRCSLGRSSGARGPLTLLDELSWKHQEVSLPSKDPSAPAKWFCSVVSPQRTVAALRGT